MKRWVEKQTLAACAVLRAKKGVNRRIWFTQQSFTQKQRKHQKAVVTKYQEAFNQDRDYICRIQTALEPFSSKSMSNFIEWWNFRINVGNSMAKNHSTRDSFAGANWEIHYSNCITFDCYSNLRFIRCRQLNKAVPRSTLEPTHFGWYIST